MRLLAISFLLTALAQAKPCPATYRALEAQILAERAVPPAMVSPKITWVTEGKGARLTAKQRAEVEQVMKEVDALLAGTFSVPEEVLLDAHPESAQACQFGLSGNRHELTLGYRDLSPIRKPSAPREVAWGRKHPTHSRSTWVHEYGHAYFHVTAEQLLSEANSRIRQRFTPPELRDRHIAADARMRELDRLTSTNDETLREWEARGLEHSRAWEELQDLNDKLEDQLMRAMTERGTIHAEVWKHVPPEANQWPEFTKGLHEVFADALAATWAGDKEVMADNLRVAGTNQLLARESAQARSFSRASRYPWTIDDSHEMFSPTRAALGKYLPGVQAPAERKQEFLRKVVAVMKQEMASWATAPLDAAGKYPPQTIATVNQSLKEKIAAEFSDWR